MQKRIFVWAAHPKSGSLSEGLADAYAVGARGQGAEVRQMNLSSMSFDLGALTGFGGELPELEPDLVQFQENLLWADHVFIAHPIWWGLMPAQAKAVLDRTLLSGFAFKYHKKGMGWDKLLAGRTADVMLTADTPSIIDTLIYWASWRRILKNQILGFIGIKTRRIQHLAPVRNASKEKIENWLLKATNWGAEVGKQRSKRPAPNPALAS